MASTGAGLEGAGIDGARVGDGRADASRGAAEPGRVRAAPAPGARPARATTSSSPSPAACPTARCGGCGTGSRPTPSSPCGPRYPRTLLRHRVGVTETERALLREAVTSWSGPVRLADAVLHTEVAPEPTGTFTEPGRFGWDAADLVLRALLPTVGEVGEVRRAWRTSPTGGPARVVLVSAAGDLPALTGAVQRALRAHGGTVPGVEVIGAGTLTTAYHRAALAASDVLWRAGAPASVSAVVPARDPGLPGPRTGGAPSPAELVRHG